MFLLAVVPLVWLMLSDLHYHRIDIVPLILFAAMQLYCGDFHYAIINSVFVALLITFLAFYIKLRWNKRAQLRDYFGEGDILFMFALTPAFDTYSFIVFLIVSFLFSALYGYLFQRHLSIPLVTTVGLCYIFYQNYNTQAYETYLTIIVIALLFHYLKFSDHYIAPNGRFFGNERFNIQ